MNIVFISIQVSCHEFIGCWGGCRDPWRGGGGGGGAACLGPPCGNAW